MILMNFLLVFSDMICRVLILGLGAFLLASSTDEAQRVFCGIFVIYTNDRGMSEWFCCAQMVK